MFNTSFERSLFTCLSCTQPSQLPGIFGTSWRYLWASQIASCCELDSKVGGYSWLTFSMLLTDLQLQISTSPLQALPEWSWRKVWANNQSKLLQKSSESRSLWPNWWYSWTMSGRQQLSDETKWASQLQMPWKGLWLTEQKEGNGGKEELFPVRMPIWRYIEVIFTHHWKASYSQLEGAAGQQDT